jgi:transglutaminase-like putative cysteine protease
MTGTMAGSRPPQGTGDGGRPGSGAKGKGGWRRHLGTAETGPARWVLATAIFGAVMATSLSLNGVLLDNSWFPRAILVTAFTVLPPALLRKYSRLSPYAPIGALLGWFMGLTLAFFPGTAYLGVIPSLGTVHAAVNLASDAATTIMINSTPVPLDDGITFVVCAGLGFVALLMDTLAITVAMPATSGLAIVLVLLPSSLTTSDGVGTVGFIGAGAGFLLVLGCCRWYAPEGRLRAGANRAASGTLTRAAVLGAAVVLLMTLLPAVVPGFTQGVFPQGSRIGSPGDVSGLDPMISLGNDLRAQSGAVSMTYMTDAPGAEYMRMSTLEDFSGKTWKPSAVPRNLSSALSGLSPALRANDAVPSVQTTTAVTIVNLTSTWLPAPLSVTNVDFLRGRWTWNPSTQTINAVSSTTADQQYVVTSAMPQLSPELLRAASQKPAPGLDPLFSKLPNNVPSIIKKTAQEVTAGKTNPYDQAMAIQDYLRSPAFTYSVKTPVQEGYDGAGMNVVAKFLEVKSGYCVHFSSAMAVMARELGIPSRIVVGFAPGTATDETGTLDGKATTGYEVAGRDAHAWPELYFEGLGWVPFEPTPSRGVVPSYAQAPATPNTNPGTNDQLNGSNSRATATAAPAPTTAAPTAAPAVAETAPPARIGATLVAGVLVLLALASPAFTRVLVRRRRLALVRGAGSGGAGSSDGPRDPRDGPQMLAWRELRSSAIDYGHRHDPSLTAAQQGRAIIDLAGQASAADVELIRDAYEQTVYGPPSGASAVGRDDLADAVERVSTAIAAGATPLARARAVALPPSLFQGLR